MSNTKKEIMSLRLADEMIFSLRARSCVYHVGFYTIPYIRAHIFSVGSANTRKHHHPMLERISSCTRSLRTWWTLDGKYLYFLFIWFNIVALIPIRRYLFWFDFFQLDEMMNLWIYQMRWWHLVSPLPQHWHLLNVNITRLASDLGQAHQKYVCTIPF